MSKVYVLTVGCYSDTRVQAVFTTREMAEEEAFSWPEYEIYELDLDARDNPLQPGYRLWRVNMSFDGSVSKVSHSDPVQGLKDNGLVLYNYWEDCLTSAVCAKTREHAVKVVAERRASLLTDHVALAAIKDEMLRLLVRYPDSPKIAAAALTLGIELESP